MHPALLKWKRRVFGEVQKPKVYEYRNPESYNNKKATPCVGSYQVSGYTRSDGVKVDDYIRRCGAKHGLN